MTRGIEGLGRYYTRSGHPEVGARLQEVADFARQQGVPEVLPPLSEAPQRSAPQLERRDGERSSDFVLRQLREAGVPERFGLAVAREMSGDLSFITDASDLCGVSDETLRGIKNIGTKSIAELRSVYPYVNEEN
jgi:hypothetical protein